MQTPQEIQHYFKSLGSKKALVYSDVDNKHDYSVSYDQLIEAVSAGSYFFTKKLELKKGATISYLFENAPEIITLNLICFLSGFCACPLDVRRDTKEVAKRKLSETNTQVLFYRANDVCENLATDLRDELGIPAYSVRDFFDLVTILGEERESFLDNFNKNSVSLVLYTSGTTGFPKGTMLTFENIWTGAQQVADWFDISGQDVFYLVLPLHHINSTIFSLSVLLRGGTVVISSRYSRTRFFKYAAQYGCTMSSIVPTINLDLLEQEDQFDSVKKELRLKRIQIGSAPVVAAHAVKFVEKYTIPLVQGYGSTETSLRATGVPTPKDPSLYQYLLSKNSIGKALSFNRVELVDARGNFISSPREEGEIVVSGLNVMQGYLHRKKETREALKSKFFYTGDIGYFEEIDGERYFFLKGRRKEIIIKGGVNISPMFIEERVRAYIQWARNVVIVGFPHYRFGEEVGMVIVPSDEGDYDKLSNLKNALRAYKINGLSSYETPASYVVAREEEIPKTTTGKIQRTKVKANFKEKLCANYVHIGDNNSTHYRIITPDEEAVLHEAVGLYNSTFIPPLHITDEAMYHRATNGFVIGGFDKQTHQLKGVLTGFFADYSLLKKNNWKELTDNGRFGNTHLKGSCAFLCSASSITSANKTFLEQNFSALCNPSLTEVKKYIEDGKNFVANFHFKPKGGFSSGAQVREIKLNANPQDYESCAVIVVFEYPEFSPLHSPTFTRDKIGVGLVEAALLYAHQSGKKNVLTLSPLRGAHIHFTTNA